MAHGHVNQFTLTGEVLNEGTYSDAGKTPVYSFQIGVETAVGQIDLKVTRWVKCFGDIAVQANDLCRKGALVTVEGRFGNEHVTIDGQDTFRDALIADDAQGFVAEAENIDRYPERRADGGRRSAGQGRDNNSGGRGNQSEGRARSGNAAGRSESRNAGGNGGGRSGGAAKGGRGRDGGEGGRGRGGEGGSRGGDNGRRRSDGGRRVADA
jgi:single-stranded DNA-binding protein